MPSLRWLFLGDLGNWLDSTDNARRVEAVRRRMQRQRSTDRRQDEQIGRLEEETTEIKTALTAVVELLVSKGLLTREEVLSLVTPDPDERAEPD